MAIPGLKVECAFGNSPNDVIRTWTDITPYVVDIQARPSSQRRALDRFNAGTMSVTLDNVDRRFEPGYVSSPYYPNIVPMRPIRFTAAAVGSTHTDFIDTFTRANGALIGSSLEQGGVTWAAGKDGANWTVSSNAAIETGNTVDGWVFFNGGSADGELVCTMTTVIAGQGVVFRADGSTNGNYYAVRVNLGGAGYSILSYNAANSPTVLSSIVGVTPTAGDIFLIDMKGTSIRVFINGLFNTSFVDSTFNTNTYHGLNKHNNGGTYPNGAIWDDIQFYPPGILWSGFVDSWPVSMPNGWEEVAVAQCVDSMAGLAQNALVYATVSDTFNRADSSSLGSTEVGAKTWSLTTASAISIVNKQVRIQQGRSVAPGAFAVCDSGLSDGIISVQLNQYNSGYFISGAGGIIFRYQDASNYYTLEYYGNATCNLYQVKAGVSSMVHTYSAADSSNSYSVIDADHFDTINIILSGSSITIQFVWWKSSTATVTDTDSPYTNTDFQTSTSHGFGWGRYGIVGDPTVYAGDQVYDNFTITPNLSHELTGTRVGKVLGFANWPVTRRLIATGQYYLSAVVNTSTTANAGIPVLSNLQICADSESGRFYADGAGFLIFQDRLTRSAPPYTTSRATFGNLNDGVEIGVTDWMFSQDTQLLFNNVTVTSVAYSTTTGDGFPSNVVVKDAASQASYLDKAVTRATNLASANDGLTLASTYLGRYSQPKTRIDSIEVDATSTLVQAIIWKLQVSDLITVNMRPMGGTVISQGSFIEGFEYNAGPARTMKVKIYLSPASEGAFWVLSDGSLYTALSVLDSTTVLG